MLFLSHSLFLRALVLLLGPLSVLGTSSEVDLIEDTVLYYLNHMVFSLNQSNPCYEDLSKVVWGLIRLEAWALSMLDAAGKPEANLLGGNVGWVGSYEQCIGIKQGSVEGQHCWMRVAIEGNEMTALTDAIAETPIIGICLPNSCRNKDFEPLTKSILELVNKATSLLAHDASLAPSIDCEYSHVQLTMTSYVATGVGCLLLLFVLLGTSADLLSQTTRDSGEKKNGETMEMKRRRKSIGFCAAFNRFVLYFSLYSNGRKLFALEKESRDVTFSQLNGLKVIATALVIFYHTFLDILYIAKNPVEVGVEWGQWYVQSYIQTYPVDIFFLIMGFLTIRGVVRKPLLRANTRFFCAYILSRYLKMLVAPLTIVLVAYVAIKRQLFSTPFWNIKDKNCSNSFWAMTFFFNNYLSSDVKQCFTFWWFLSATIQLHLLSLVVIVPLINKRYSLSVLGGSALLMGSWLWLAWKSVLLPLYPQTNNLGEFLTYIKDHLRFVIDIFTTPIYHMGPYLVGMGLAGLMFKYKAGFSLTKMGVCVGWVLSTLGLYFVNYAVCVRPNRMLRLLHMIFGTTIYSLSLAWIVFICDTKNNGILSRVLRWKYWLPLSKLSLGAYLLNKVVIEFFYYSEVDKLVFSWPLLCIFFIRNWAVTYSMAVIATLTMEMPLNVILDAIFTYNKKTIKIML